MSTGKVQPSPGKAEPGAGKMGQGPDTDCGTKDNLKRINLQWFDNGMRGNRMSTTDLIGKLWTCMA